VTITSSGYTGSVNESQWAALADKLGTAYCVGASGDLACTIGGTSDRAVTVAPGTAYGRGVKDVFSTATNLNATSVGSGTRWDTVCIRRDWTAGTGTGTSLVIVPGTSTKAITKGFSTPGTTDDQPIALILLTAGSTTVTLLESLIPTGGKSLYVPTTFGIGAGYTPPPGALWYVAANGHQWVSLPSGATDLDAPNWTAFPLAGGSLTALDTTPKYSFSRGRVDFTGSIQRSGTPHLPLISSAYATNGTADVVLGTMPGLRRPGQTVRFELPELGGTGRCRGAVGSDGNVKLYSDGVNINAVAIDAIHYFAEQ